MRRKLTIRRKNSIRKKLSNDIYNRWIVYNYYHTFFKFWFENKPSRRKQTWKFIKWFLSFMDGSIVRNSAFDSHNSSSKYIQHGKNIQKFYCLRTFFLLIFKGKFNIFAEWLDKVIVLHYDSYMTCEVCDRCRTLISTLWNQLKKLSWSIETILVNKLWLHYTVVWKMPHTADIMY